VSKCLRSEIKKNWLRPVDDAPHISFQAVPEFDYLVCVCMACTAIMQANSLATAKEIGPDLVDEVAGIRDRFIQKHRWCERTQPKEEPNLEHFPSGSIRDSQEGRGRYDLIPPGPYKRLALRTELGAKRYGDNNWKKGQPLERYLNSLKRHITEYELGDRSEDHLAAGAWNLFSAMWTEDEIKAGRLSV